MALMTNMSCLGPTTVIGSYGIKTRGDLVNILEGDGSIANTIEGHPHLPVVV